MAVYRRPNTAREAKQRFLNPEQMGLQPRITVEVYERLTVAFREYRRLFKEGNPTKPAEEKAIFYAGWLSHYFGDAPTLCIRRSNAAITLWPRCEVSQAGPASSARTLLDTSW
jgi:hypothetical protein